MGKAKHGNVQFNPAADPAVLDSATWDIDGAANAVFSVPASFWNSLLRGLSGSRAKVDLSGGTSNGGTAQAEVSGAGVGVVTEAGSGYRIVESDDGPRVYLDSAVTVRDLLPGGTRVSEGDGVAVFLLCRTPDGMEVLVRLTRDGTPSHPSLGLGAPRAARTLGEVSVAVFPCDGPTIYAYTGSVDRERGSRALGAVPRLGIGNRHSVLMWPGIFRAISGSGTGRVFSANAVQNSLRELNLLDEFLAGGPPKENYLFGYGSIQEGHTGSTFEGLWTYGVLAALKAGCTVPFGADADHIQVKRGPAGLERAKQVVRAARHYSFYTLDVSDILDYAALDASLDAQPEKSRGEKRGASRGESFDEAGLRELVSFHRRRRRVGLFTYEPADEHIRRMARKYHRALDAVGELASLLSDLKQGHPFDLELSVDEHPPEIDSFGSVTSEDELVFLLLEGVRRGMPLTHVAPNFGVEKGVDYRCPDGHEGLAGRVESLTRIAEAFGIMLDCHSGDDLSQETRRVIGRASSGRIHFKVSPSLQTLFADTLYDFHPDLFGEWWKATLAYAKAEAENGGTAALEAVKEYERDGGGPHPSHSFFRHLCFAPVGERDTDGNFILRERLYGISAACLEEYTRRTAELLSTIAEDIFGQHS